MSENSSRDRTEEMRMRKAAKKKKVALMKFLTTIAVIAVIAVICFAVKASVDKKAADSEASAINTVTAQSIPDIQVKPEPITASTTTEKQTGASKDNPQSNQDYLIKVNRTQNIVTVYTADENGQFTKPYKAMVCSVGLNNETPTGTFKTADKYDWRLLTGNVYGQYATRITERILFHSVPYYTQDKGDLESEEYNKLGQAASLGCVRLSVEDAKWIYDNCKKGTTVTIYDSSDPEPIKPPNPIKIDLNDSRKGWDPTDPDVNNPW